MMLVASPPCFSFGGTPHREERLAGIRQSFASFCKGTLLASGAAVKGSSFAAERQ